MPYNVDADPRYRTERNGLLYKATKFICKWCKVEVMSKTDHSAKLGHEHKTSCPRHRLGR
jgi:hypothetical protein